MLPELKTMLLSTVAIVRKIWPRPSVQLIKTGATRYQPMRSLIMSLTKRSPLVTSVKNQMKKLISRFPELTTTILSMMAIVRYIWPRTSTPLFQLIKTGAASYQPIKTVIVTSKKVMFQLTRRCQMIPLIPVKLAKNAAVYLARTKNTSVSYASWSSLVMQA